MSLRNKILLFICSASISGTALADERKSELKEKKGHGKSSEPRVEKSRPDHLDRENHVLNDRLVEVLERKIKRLEKENSELKAEIELLKNLKK